MINPSFNRTPEERRASAAKGRATRRSNREATLAARDEVRYGIAHLKAQLAALRSTHAAALPLAAATLAALRATGKKLYAEEQIVRAAKKAATLVGVYFLIRSDRVVYVGQSTNVMARIAQHKTKEFDAYAYVPCAREQLDLLESLYIHGLQPPLNGNARPGLKLAPCRPMIPVRNLLTERPDKQVSNAAKSLI